MATNRRLRDLLLLAAALLLSASCAAAADFEYCSECPELSFATNYPRFEIPRIVYAMRASVGVWLRR